MGDLGDLNTLALEARIRLYADGDKENEIPPRSFDFNKRDTDLMLTACNIVRWLAAKDYPHNFQLERFDLRDYCWEMSNIQKAAKRLLEQIKGDAET